MRRKLRVPEIISAASPQARDRIDAGILRVLLRRSDWPGSDSGFRSLDAYANAFLQYCAEFHRRPELQARQLYEHKFVTIFRYTRPVLSFRCDADEDAGGAHPFGTSFFINFESSTGKTVVIADLLREGALAKRESVAEANFRQDFGIGETKLVFLFNTYEIGARVMGAKEIRIVYALIRDLL